MLVAWAVLEQACGALGPDLGQVIAIVVTTPDSVEQYDTLRAHATAVTAAGDSVADTVYWASLDTNVLAPVDSVSGGFTGRQPGTTRIQARTGNLRSGAVAVTVTAAADTVTAAGPTRDTITVSAPDSLSDTLAVLVADTGASASDLIPLVNRPVVFAIAASPGITVSLVPDDTTHAIVTTDTVRTDATGTARVLLRYLGGGTLPDSVTVTAEARRAVGTPVPGSPVGFVVELTP